MNKALLWKAVLIEIFAAVVTTGLRQQTSISKEIKLVCMCRMDMRGVTGSHKEREENIPTPAS